MFQLNVPCPTRLVKLLHAAKIHALERLPALAAPALARLIARDGTGLGCQRRAARRSGSILYFSVHSQGDQGLGGCLPSTPGGDGAPQGGHRKHQGIELLIIPQLGEVETDGSWLPVSIRPDRLHQPREALLKPLATRR